MPHSFRTYVMLAAYGSGNHRRSKIARNPRILLGGGMCLSSAVGIHPLELWRQANTPHKIVKAGIGAQGVKAGIDLEIDKTHIARVIRLLQPFKRFLFFAESGIDERYLVPANTVFSYVFLQLRNGLSGHVRPARAGVRIAQMAQGTRSIARLQEFADRLRVHALFRVNIA